MKEIDPKETARKYNEIDTIWDPEDKWHWRTNRMIRKFIFDSLNSIPGHKNLKILNAGSAGYSYELHEEQMLHVDIADKKIAHLPNSLIADIQNLPIPDKQFDMVICVGSVLNYCDPYLVFGELRRVLKPNGYLILEFENSKTLELTGTDDFNKGAVFVETFYKNQSEKIWYFAESFIRELASTHGFVSKKRSSCHILSPLFLKWFKNEKWAALWGAFDPICKLIPGLNKFSSNTIFLFQQQTAG